MSYTYFTYKYTINPYACEIIFLTLIFLIYVYAKNQKKGHIFVKVSLEQNLEGRKKISTFLGLGRNFLRGYEKK